MLSHRGMTSIHPITEWLSLFAISSATCGISSSHEVLTSLRTTNGLPSSIPQIVVRHLGGSSRPEAHLSIRHDTTWNVITELRCHFGSCVLTCFRMFYFTIPQTNLHLSVLHMSFSLAVWNCQVQFYTSLSSELCTNPLPEMHIRVETL